MDDFRKGNIIICLLLLLATNLVAQEISIIDFQRTNELTAIRPATAKIDSLDDNKKMALIRVQTTEKGFSFDVGSVGVEVDENHVAEIWVYVGRGARHIFISHKKYGVLAKDFEFPEPLESGVTYVMKIKCEGSGANAFDNSRHQKFKLKVTPVNSIFRLNGVKIALNENGEPEEELELPYATNQYTVESEGYYRQDSIITVDDKEVKELEIILTPIMGFLKVDADPFTADVYIDNVYIDRANKIEPFKLRIGEYSVRITANGYKDEVKTVVINEKTTSLISVKLTQKADYHINSSPSGAHISIDKEYIGTSPCVKEMVTGKHIVKATKAGYKNFEREMQLNSSNPYIDISLNKIFNYKNEFYIEANGRVGNMTAFGGTIGFYLGNFNLETSFLHGIGDSETIYWNSRESEPIECTYSPAMNFVGKIGFGIPTGTRFRFTPQFGVNLLKLNEKATSKSSVNPADGANVVSGLASLRISFAVVNHFELTITPEYSFAMTKSKGYITLSELSSKIKGWGEGFNVKFGMALFF